MKLDDFLSPFCRTPNNKKLVSYGLFMQKPVESLSDDFLLNTEAVLVTDLYLHGFKVAGVSP